MRHSADLCSRARRNCAQIRVKRERITRNLGAITPAPAGGAQRFISAQTPQTQAAQPNPRNPSRRSLHPKGKSRAAPRAKTRSRRGRRALHLCPNAANPSRASKPAQPKQPMPLPHGQKPRRTPRGTPRFKPRKPRSRRGRAALYLCALSLSFTSAQTPPPQEAASPRLSSNRTKAQPKAQTAAPSASKPPAGGPSPKDPSPMTEMVVKLIAISDYFLMHLKCGHMPARLHTDYGRGS